MYDLSVFIHNNNSAAIEDMANEIDMSQSKWTYIFDFLAEHSSVSYFKGTGFYFKDQEFESTIDYVSDEILGYDGEDYFRLLFRVKESALIYNRNLISKLWNYYEYPAFIFLIDHEDEKDLVEEFKKSSYVDEMLENVPGIYILYRSFNQSVLWLKSGSAIPSISEAFNEK